VSSCGGCTSDSVKSENVDECGGGGVNGPGLTLLRGKKGRREENNL
jgi:hypothetical protein